jgi:hypothetical protein
MQLRSILISIFIVLGATTMQAHQHEAQSAPSTAGWPTAPAAEFAASTERTFD